MADAVESSGPVTWTSPEWHDEAGAWIRDRLAARGIEQVGAVEQPHVRWWSTVLRVPTNVGDCYFKALSPLHVFEAALTRALAQWVPDLVPELVAVDESRGWILMRDGGRRLRELVREPADLRHWERVLPRYAELQIDVASHREELLALGVPDLRVSRLAGDLERLLDEPDLLLRGEEALTADELARLRGAVPEVAAMCEQLAAHGLPETLQHDDFHDGNVFVQDGGYRVLDWGDSCVSHPFHTLVVTLRSIAYRFDLEPGAPVLLRLRDAYLEPWAPFGDAKALGAAFEIAYRTGTIGRALAWHRFVSARDDPPDDEDAGSVPYGLRIFLAGGPIGSWR